MLDDIALRQRPFVVLETDAREAGTPDSVSDCHVPDAALHLVGSVVEADPAPHAFPAAEIAVAHSGVLGVHNIDANEAAIDSFDGDVGRGAVESQGRADLLVLLLR